jgi:prepilin-type N-terminal cleavage/methylation domain-containing protein
MMRNRNGWTLIELIVAIGLLAVMLSIGSLAQGKLLPQYRLSAAARQVVTDLRLLRSKAISQNHQFRMIFDSGSNTYRAERWDSATSAWEHYALYRRGATVSVGAQPVSLPGSVTTSAVQVTFDPRGTVDITSGTQPIVLTAPGPRTRNVSINVAGLIDIS